MAKGYIPKIGPNTVRVLWSCDRDGESFIMESPLKSHKLCPECRKAMRIEKTVEA